MKIIVSGLGGKHELDVSPEDALRAVKQKLEPMTGLDSAQMKLLVKGKSPDDGATVGALGLADGAKVMLMRSQLGAKKEAASAPPPTAGGGGPSWLVGGAKVLYRAGDGSLEHAVVRVVHTDDPAAPYYTIDVGGAERQTPGDRLLRPDATAPTPPPAAPSEAGAGPISLTVTQGKRQLLLRAEPATTVAALKALLSGMLDGAAPAAMKLLYKGRLRRASDCFAALPIPPDPSRSLPLSSSSFLFSHQARKRPTTRPRRASACQRRVAR